MKKSMAGKFRYNPLNCGMRMDLLELFSEGATLLSSEVREKIRFRAGSPNSRDRRRFGKMTVQQDPYELDDFLLWLKENKIQKYLEVGCAEGGLLCVVDQFLRSCFSDVETLAVDVVNIIRNYSEYHEIYPRCRYQKIDHPYIRKGRNCIFKNDGWLPDKNYDLIFMDTNEGWCVIRQQLERVKPFAKYIALHDISISRCGGSHIFWNRYADDWGKLAYFCHHGPGIGIVTGGWDGK